MIGLRTLVLNSNYIPISLFPLHSIPAEDAVTRVYNETCHVVFEYDRPIKTANLKMNWPSVVARNDMLPFSDKVKLRRDSLFYRDHGICAYCEKPLTINTLTYDHVQPRSLGGEHGWKNLVCSCASCNLRKGNNLPVGEWKPKMKPYEPSYWELLNARKKFPIAVPDMSWTNFLGDWEGGIQLPT
jgi:5-methylcytosine-specific restriction endonuclease McrA